VRLWGTYIISKKKFKKFKIKGIFKEVISATAKTCNKQKNYKKSFNKREF